MPPHVEEAVQAIGELHRQHQRRATPTQLAVSRLTAFVGRPRFAAVVTFFLVLWISGNSALQAFGRHAWDPAPFNFLQVATGIASVYITVLILIAQRRENELSEARDQLTLELALLNEQKSAKIVALLEELRRDSPSVPDRVDPEAELLSAPADPLVVLEAIRATTEELALLPLEPTEDAMDAAAAP